jgi:hypothetical protein
VLQHPDWNFRRKKHEMKEAEKSVTEVLLPHGRNEKKERRAGE